MLISYFENPVIAPVKALPPKLVFEQKIQEVVEEEKTESKTSIWSNFSEVLKRPPREKLKFAVQVEKKDEDEDEEGPIKLTLFDLIKPRNNS